MLFQRIRELREYEVYTMQEIANKLGVSKSTYSLWEYGIDVIPLTRIINLANIYCVNLDYILGLTNHKEVKQLYDKVDLKLLGSNLCFVRKSLNQTQTEFAKSINCSRSSLSNYERGTVMITTLPLLELCRNYSISAEKILYDKTQNFQENS